MEKGKNNRRQELPPAKCSKPMGTLMARDEAASSGSSSLSSTLLDQLRLRRPEAWERFVKIYSPIIYRWCRRSGLAAEDAADVFQEVLASVIRRLPEFRRDRPQDTFTGWLAAITRNKVRDHYRRRHGRARARGGTTAQRQLADIPDQKKGTGPFCRNGPEGASHNRVLSPFSDLEDSIQPDAESAAWLSRQTLNVIRAEFEVRTWEAFWRTTIDGQPPAGVAEDLAMTVPAVYMAKSRVLRRLRQVLGELP
jgi:RNA polymerase sigma-70 factor, ECF subfamily